MDNKIQLVPTIKDDLKDNSCWCASFNLVWNKFQNEILQNDFSCFNDTKITQNLIATSQYKLILDDDLSIVEAGRANSQFKEKLINLLKEKFNEDSDILNNIDFSSNNLLLYSMIKCSLEFENEYQKYNDRKFARFDKNINFFGFDSNNIKYNDQILPLFYLDENDFAVCLYTTTNQSIILYRTNENANFEKTFISLYQKLEEFSKRECDLSINSFFAPSFNINIKQNYEELCGQSFLRNTDNETFEIASALQTLNIEVNESGAKVKSEAELMVKETAFFGPRKERKTISKDFIFDDSYYMFIIDENSPDLDCPFVAVKIHDIENFI